MDLRKMIMGDRDLDDFRNRPIIKYSLISAGLLFLVFISGHVFSIIANSVVSYKRMMNAIKVQ